jgi:hypothetical protein
MRQDELPEAVIAGKAIQSFGVKNARIGVA